MTLRFLIVGYKGNMGRRYAAIFDHLGVEWNGLDVHEQSMKYEYDNYDGVVFATPTANHLEDIKNHIGKSAAPILMEKPISKSAFFELPDFRIMMINQYRHLVPSVGVGPTEYNYFKTGADGIEWDCINIVGMAKREVTLSNGSPIWRCLINGTELNIRDMDYAYVAEIMRFVKACDTGYDWAAEREYIYGAHRKVRELIAKGKRNG